MTEHVQAQLVGPVQVLENDQDRSARIGGHQQVGQVLHQHAAPVVRVAGGSGDRPHPRRQAPPQLGQGRLAGGQQVTGQVQQQAGQRLHVIGERRRPDHGEAAGVGPPCDGAEQACLADACLARDEQQPAFARRGGGEPVLDKGQERVPADQDRRLDAPASPHDAPPPV